MIRKKTAYRIENWVLPMPLSLVSLFGSGLGTIPQKNLLGDYFITEIEEGWISILKSLGLSFSFYSGLFVRSGGYEAGFSFYRSGRGGVSGQ